MNQSAENVSSIDSGRALHSLMLFIGFLLVSALGASATIPPTLEEVAQLFAKSFSCQDDKYQVGDTYTIDNITRDPSVLVTQELLLVGNTLQNRTEDARTQFLLRKTNALGQFRSSNDLSHNNTCFLPPQCNQFFRSSDVITGSDPIATGVTFGDAFDEDGFFRELDLFRARIRYCSRSDAGNLFHLATGAAAVHSVSCAALSTRLGRYAIESNPFVRDELLGFFQFAASFSSNRSSQGGGYTHASRVSKRIIAQYSRSHIVDELYMPLLGEAYFQENLQQTADNMRDALGTAQLTTAIQSAVTTVSSTTESVVFAVASLSSANSIASVRTMADSLVSTQQNQILALTQNLDEEWDRLSNTFYMSSSKNITSTFEHLRDVVRNLNDDLANICRSEAIMILIFAVLIEAAKNIFSLGFATVALKAVESSAKAAVWATRAAKTSRAAGLQALAASKRAQDMAKNVEHAEEAIELALTINAVSDGQIDQVPVWEALTDPISAALNVASLEDQIKAKKAQNEQLFSRIGELVLGFVDQATAMRLEFVALATYVANDATVPTVLETDSSSFLRVSVAAWQFLANELRDALVSQSGGICLSVPSAGSINGRLLEMSLPAGSDLSIAESPDERASMLELRRQSGGHETRELQGCLNQKDRSRFFKEARAKCDGAMQEVFDYADLMQMAHNQLIRVVDLHRQIAVAKMNAAQIRSGYEDFATEVNENSARFRAEASRAAFMRLIGTRQVKSFVQLDMLTILDVVSENVEEACLAFKYFYPGQAFAISSTQYNSFFAVNQTSCSVSFTRSDVLSVNMESLLTNAVSGLTVLRRAQYLSAARRDAIERPTVKTLACELNLADVERDATSVTFQVLPFSVVDEDGILCDENQELQFASFVPVSNAEKPYEPTSTRGRLAAQLTGPLLKVVNNREFVYGAGAFRFNTEFDVAGCDGTSSDVSTRINHRDTIKSNICDGVSVPNSEWARPSPFGIWNVSLRVDGSNLFRDSTKLIAIFKTVSRNTDNIRCQTPGWPRGVFNTSVRTCLPVGTGVSLKAASQNGPFVSSNDPGPSILGIALGSIAAVGVLAAATVVLYKNRHRLRPQSGGFQMPTEKHNSMIPQEHISSSNPLAQFTETSIASSGLPPPKVEV